MTDIFSSVLSMSQEKKIDMRMAAWILGISRISEAQELRGLYP
jgi:glutamate dehydrogenase/leucine dehydrogenase